MVKKELRILMIEDAPTDVVLINHELRRGGLHFRSKRVQTEGEFLLEIDSHPPDLILSDHGLPSFDGFSALKIARTKCPEIPFIFVTNAKGEELAIDSLRAGAVDYVLKERLPALLPAVQRALRLAEEQRKRRQAEDRYRGLVELCPDALFVVSAGRIVFVNTAAQTLLGAGDPGELIGMAAESLVKADRRGEFSQRLEEWGGTGPPQGVDISPGPSQLFKEETFRRLDDSTVEVEMAAARLIFQDVPATQLIAHDITQRKRVAAALAESEQRKAAILETSLDAIMSIDHKGVIREWNAAAERIFGYPRKDAMGRLLDKLIIPPSLGEKYLPGLADYLITGVGSLIGRPIELMARRASNAEFPVELSITRTPVGELFTVFVRDITDRKRSEEVLRQSEARKAAVVETALDAIVAIDHDGRIIEWNPAAEKMFGYSRALATGRDVAELIVPESFLEDHREGFLRYLRANRGRMIGQRTEMTAVRANGAEFPIEIVVTRTIGAVVPSFIAYIRDITDRRRIEEALRKSEERLRLLVESVEDYAIYMLDMRGRVITWNSGAERIEGYRAKDVVRRKFTLFYTAEEISEGKPDQALAVAKAEGRFGDERWRVRPDGSRYWANIVVTALREKQGLLYGFSVIARDMTKQKEAEDGTRRLNAELEHRVQERTAELQSAYEEMESFSYSISHDLRAPLVHIGGFAEMLHQDAGAQLDEKCRHYLQVIGESARRMGRMIDDLLAFSRMSRAELHKIRVDVGDIVKGVIHDMRSDMENRKIVWNIGDLPKIQGDPALLYQAVFNLIANALKYTRTRAEARIEIGVEPSADEIVFFVRDNGVGFDNRHMDKLFGVFQRLHSASEFEGTGIGLANVRRIIQRHGGRVWAEGKVDGGATFYFSIPKGKEAARGPSELRPARGG